MLCEGVTRVVDGRPQLRCRPARNTRPPVALSITSPSRRAVTSASKHGVAGDLDQSPLRHFKHGLAMDRT